MNTLLDSSSAAQNAPKVSFLPTALLYGVLGGLVIIIYTYLNYTTFFAVSNFGGLITGFFIQAGIWFGTVTLAIRKHRDKDLGGYINMGRCLGLGIVVVIIATIMYVFFSYAYALLINPGIEKQLAEKMSWFFQMLNMDEEQIELMITQVQETKISTLPYTLLASIFSGGIIGLIVSAITGAVLRRSQPNMA